MRILRPARPWPARGTPVLAGGACRFLPSSRSYAAMPYSKKQALMKFHSGWAEVERVPPLVLVDAHDAVAEVVVLAEHVGVGVVQLVVRVLPHARPATTRSHSQVVEWIFGSRIQSHWPCRTLWPISMFSMIFATDSPAVPTIHAGGNKREQQHGPAAQLELALAVDDLADVGGVALAAAGDDLGADRVELTAEVLDVVRQQRWAVGVGFCALASRHCGFPFLVSEFSEFDVAAPAAADTQVWMTHAVGGGR